jgi:hypothetical protein
MFHDIEARYLHLLADYLTECDVDWERLEAMRRIAECILSAACEKAGSFEECDRRRRVREALGFSNIERKTESLTIFARYCFNHGRAEFGLILMKDLLAEIQSLGAEAEGSRVFVQQFIEKFSSDGTER